MLRGDTPRQKTQIKFKLIDIEDNWRINLNTLERSFTINNDMAAYLNNRVDMNVSVMTV
jgi:DNA polymerase III subunit alpha